MRTLGLFVLCAALLFTGHGAPVEKRRESTKEILELESLLKKSAGEDKQVFPSQLQKEAKAKEAKLAAEAAAKDLGDDGMDLPPVPPAMQVDGLAEKDELEAQLKQQQAATSNQNLEEAAEEVESDDAKEDGERAEETNEEIEDTEDEPEMLGEVEKREKELFMKYLKESPEVWQQLMDSLQYGNDWQQDKYSNPEDEYPALMQEWRAAADKNQNYIPQEEYEPEVNQESQATEEGELENELPQVPHEFNNLEELQEYYSDKLAEENAKKLGYGRPDWVDESQDGDPSIELENINDEHNTQDESSVQDQLMM